jgi:hypothetical protein
MDGFHCLPPKPYAIQRRLELHARFMHFINPHTFPRDIKPRGKDLKPPFLPAARPQGILEGVGINTGVSSFLKNLTKEPFSAML